MWKATYMKMICYSHSKTHFHQNGFAVSFVLKVGDFNLELGKGYWPLTNRTT